MTHAYFAQVPLHFLVSQTWLISMAFSQGIHATYHYVYHLVKGLIISLYHLMYICEPNKYIDPTNFQRHI